MKTIKTALIGFLLTSVFGAGFALSSSKPSTVNAEDVKMTYDLQTDFCEEVGDGADINAWGEPWGVEALNLVEFLRDGQGVNLEDQNAKLPEYGESGEFEISTLSLHTYPCFHNAGMTESGGYFNQYPDGWKMYPTPSPESVACWPADQGYCSADTTYFKFFYKAGALHPGKGAGEVVYFTAPRTGNVYLNDTISISNTGSDGVYLSIYKIPAASFKSHIWNNNIHHGLFGGSPIFPHAGESPTSDLSTWFKAASGTSTDYQTQEFAVEQGDVVAWIYNAGTGNDYDFTYTSPKVNYVEDYDSITLSSSSLDLAQTQTAQLTATIAPDTSATKNVIWSSSDETVATVSDTGLVTGINEGNATITAVLEGGSPKAPATEVKATCEVAVHGTSTVKITNKESSLSIMQGDSVTMTYEAFPSDSKVVWSISSGEDIASIDEQGLVLGKLPGTATIRATIEDTGVYDEVTLTVTAASAPVLTLSEKDSVSVNLGSSVTITTSVTPNYYVDATVYVTIDDLEIAEATWENKTITITGKTRGVTTLRATIDGGNSLSLTISVSKDALRTYNWSDEFADPMPSHWEHAMISDGVYNSDLTACLGHWGYSWETKGSMQSLAYRDTSIDYWCIFGGQGVHPLVGHQCAISFIAPYDGKVDFNSHFVSQSGNVQRFQILVNGVKAYPAEDEWEEVSHSHSADIYLYDIDVKKGDVIRTIVDSGDNDSNDFCFVNPIVKYTEATFDPGIVELDQTELTLNVNEYVLLKATVANADYAGKKLTWSSSNEKVATVNSAGEVTAHHSGTAVITVSLEGGNTASCTINVPMTTLQISLIAGGSGAAVLAVAAAVVIVIVVVKKKKKI